MKSANLVSAFALLATLSAVALPRPSFAAEPAGAGAPMTSSPAATPTYTAAQFFDTTSYSLAYGGARAFSPDGRFVLISSDKTGVFNAYAQPVAGGEPVQLTASTTSAARAVSYFPADGRILFTQDGGGDELNHLFV